MQEKRTRCHFGTASRKVDFLLCAIFAVPPPALLAHGDEVLIDALLGDQFLVGAPLGDLPVGYHQDLVGTPDGVQAVGDDQQSLSEMACWM